MAHTEFVTIAVVTFNSGRFIKKCLESVLAQRYPRKEVIVIDNASTDGTQAVLEQFEDSCRVILNDTNVGFAAAQNQAIKLSRGEWVLTLNPDLLLTPNFIEALLDAGLRHLDRGSQEVDNGHFLNFEYVFGATAAAALYRREMIEDVSLGGEFFDPDFFVYREDADVAWRAQLMGWRCLYTPHARGYHVRSVLPGNRRALPADGSVKLDTSPVFVETSGPVQTQWLLLFGLGSDFGGSPKYQQTQLKASMGGK